MSLANELAAVVRKHCDACACKTGMQKIASHLECMPFAREIISAIQHRERERDESRYYGTGEGDRAVSQVLTQRTGELDTADCGQEMGRD